MQKLKNDRIGETILTNEGYYATIIEYNKYSDIIVEIQDEYKMKIHTTYQHFKKKEIKNPYHKSKYNVASIGNTTTKDKKSYKKWSAMIDRCYGKQDNNNIVYKDCYVCNEWLCFENFEKWYNENYYKIDNEEMQLDKDILKKGNKCYCPQYCCFVPKRINTLFIKCDNARTEKDLPIGVTKHITRYGKLKYRVVKYPIGILFEDINEAFYVYKENKEKEIKKIADEYKDKIPQNLYDAMYNYKVEIND